MSEEGSGGGVRRERRGRKRKCEEGEREGGGGETRKLLQKHHLDKFLAIYVCMWSWEECTWLVLWAGNPVQTKDVSISSGDIVSLSSVALRRDQADLGKEEGNRGST